MTKDHEPRMVAPETYSRELMLSLGHGEEYLVFVESQGTLLRPRVERSLRYGQVEEGLRVLDVGCGRGEVTARAARAGADVVGIDYSRDCVSLTRDTLAQLDQYAGLAMADATSLPFADGLFDRIFLLDVIEHLQAQQAIDMMRELKRVLRSDGYVVIHTLPNRWTLSIGYKLARMAIRSLPDEPRSHVERAVHVGEQDISSLQRILNQAGLTAHIWLDDAIVEQSQWGGSVERDHSAREAAYALFRRPIIRILYRLAMKSPLRLLFANDIYCIAWRCGSPRPALVRHQLPPARFERALLLISSLLR